MAVIAVIAVIVAMNLWLMDVNFFLALALVVIGLAIAAIGDATSEKKEPKQTVSMTKAARQQQDLVNA